MELQICRREHFNRWYSVRAYYTALSITDIPFTIISTFIYIFLTYTLTDQPMEEFRIVSFLTIGLLTSFVAQGFGMWAGSLFGLKVICETL
jgi:ABC-2 type transporter